jgi:hypothetical protein
LFSMHKALDSILSTERKDAQMMGGL